MIFHELSYIMDICYVNGKALLAQEWRFDFIIMEDRPSDRSEHLG